jgi:hypothetical protein
MTVASMVTPTTPASADQAMLRSLDRQSYESAPNSAGLSVNGDSHSRRESVDSRINQGFGDMRLAGSPYASNNQSTTSIQSSLQQQRNPGSGPERQSLSRYSNSYQPSSQRLPEAPKQGGPRTAPTITGPATGNIARAPEPTKGQAWAFPEEEVQRLPSAARPSGDTGSRQGTSFLDSRRSSIADSIASSQFTTESRLPPGQRRLEDGMPVEYQRLSRASSEFPSVSHHHHSLQHKQIGDLQGEDAGSPGSGQPYSRTPELRISHKLAERKRRTEMKELFETLRDLMPQERGSKASKWEILTKAIAEHQKQQDCIRSLTSHWQQSQQELENMRRESNGLRLENSQLRSELSNLSAAGHSAAPVNGAPLAGHPAAPPTPMESYSADPYTRGNRVDPYAPRGTELPPLRSLNGAVQPTPESMTGVQYQNEPTRVNGFRTERY